MYEKNNFYSIFLNFYKDIEMWVIKEKYQGQDMFLYITYADYEAYFHWVIDI